MSLTDSRPTFYESFVVHPVIWQVSSSPDWLGRLDPRSPVGVSQSGPAYVIQREIVI